MSNPTDIIVSHTALAHLLNKQLQTQTTAQTKKTQTKLNNIKKAKHNERKTIIGQSSRTA